jgi:hypothetical protein
MATSSLASSAVGKKSPAISVIIPTWDREDLLQACLTHLRRQTINSFRVLVVDNGSGERVSEYPDPDGFHSLERVRLTTNHGTSVAFNRGVVRWPESEYVFLLNNDVELEPDCVAQLVRALEENPPYSVAVPKLLQWKNPKLLDGAGDELLLGGGAYRVGYGEMDAGQYDRQGPVFSACGAAALYRRSFFDSVGGFDEDFFAYRDDVDLSLRAQLRGHRILYVPRARGRHRGSATLGSPFHPLVIRLSTRNQICLLVKNYPVGVLARLWFRLAVFHLLWFGLAVKKFRLLAWCRGVLGALALLPGMLRKRREVMQGRLLSDADLLARLKESEERIRRWQESPLNQRPSRLLLLYFRVFKK